jgi:NAD(P)-dependent dehydrogenase (short-subunit alcohol dehydrogenase family)
MAELHASATGRLEGKVAVITGGTGNVGLGIARRFGREGAAVALLGRDEVRGTAAQAELTAAGVHALFVEVDVQSEAQVQRAVARVAATFGAITSLVNSAGATRLQSTHNASLGDMTLEHWADYVRVNTTGPFLCTKYALPHLLEAGRSTIVNIGSIAGRHPMKGSGAYAASKGALTALTRAVAVDYAPAVRCNEIVLGFVPGDAPVLAAAFAQDTAAAMRKAVLTDRFGTPDDVAYACVYLCSEESGYVTGASLRMDGGAGCASPYPTLHPPTGGTPDD